MSERATQPERTEPSPLASRLPVALPHAYRLLNHGPTVLVSAAHNGQRNVMAAAWCMPLDFDPPKLAVVIDKQTFTRTLIDASGELVIQVPPAALRDAVVRAGTLTGHEVDKFAACGLVAEDSGVGQAPLVAGCLAWLAGRVLPKPELAADHDLFLVEVVAAWADPRVFAEGRWRETPSPALRSLHHVAGGTFFCSGALLAPNDDPLSAPS